MGTIQTELNEFKIYWIKSCPDEALERIYKYRIEDGEIDPTTDYMGQELKLRERNKKLQKIINKMKLNEKTYEDLMNYLSDKEFYVRGDLIIKNVPEISNGANLREMINKLRTDGVPIVSTSRGYKLSKDKEEVLACITSLQSRINMMKNARDGMLDFLRSDPFQEPIN